MSYPPPPGISNLPPRPPASTSKPGFKSAFNSAPRPAAQPYTNVGPQQPTTTSYAPATQYGPNYGSYGGGAPGAVSSAPSYSSYPQTAPSYGHQGYGSQSYAAPQIKNPFPTPGTGAAVGGGAGDYDPDMAAQIAQWQSAYVSRDATSTPTSATTKDGKPAFGADLPKPEAALANANPEKKKTVVREGGGKKWTDDSLLEWDPSHLRLFVGNLAGETTDESLLKAFSRWKSVQKARVIRDKRTTKSKGFGFVSFSDADDFFQAAKEMNGKYIQSHPVVIRKANTEIKTTTVKEKERGRKNNHHNNKKKNDQGGSYEPSLGPMPGQGVTKPGQKMKNGLRLLG
ncbi:RNA-binding protein [Paramyrothecium foliicola]|nr:RNA-binding protein [Paramyrothecium foliicola]